MIAVALSGVLGRYLYLQIPRTRAGDELSLAEVEELRGELTRKLRDELHLPEATLAELDRIALGGILVPPRERQLSIVVPPAVPGCLTPYAAPFLPATAATQSSRNALPRVAEGRHPAGAPEGSSGAAPGAVEPPATALPLLARLPQAFRGGDVRVHGRPHRGGPAHRIRLGTPSHDPPLGGAPLLLFLPVALPLSAQLSPGKLSQAHAALEGSANCLKCHQAGKGVTAARCLDCHTALKSRVAAGQGLHARPGHQKCETCHNEHHGREFQLVYWGKAGPSAFDHRQTGFPLDGAHAAQGCRECHRPAFQRNQPGCGQAGPIPRTFLGLSRACLSCHRDEHRGQLAGQTCLSCHTMTSWRPPAKFDHGQDRLSLDRTACAGGLRELPPARRDTLAADPDRKFMVFRGLAHQRCSDCHKDPHQGRFGATCQSCHSTAGWKEGARARFDHGKTGFPLTGRHRNVACASCHRTRGSSGEVVFNRMAHGKCTDCHKDPHRGRLGDDLPVVPLDGRLADRRRPLRLRPLAAPAFPCAASTARSPARNAMRRASPCASRNSIVAPTATATPIAGSSRRGPAARPARAATRSRASRLRSSRWRTTRRGVSRSRGLTWRCPVSPAIGPGRGSSSASPPPPAAPATAIPTRERSTASSPPEGARPATPWRAGGG